MVQERKTVSQKFTKLLKKIPLSGGSRTGQKSCLYNYINEVRKKKFTFIFIMYSHKQFRSIKKLYSISKQKSVSYQHSFPNYLLNESQQKILSPTMLLYEKKQNQEKNNSKHLYFRESFKNKVTSNSSVIEMKKKILAEAEDSKNV